MCPQIHQYIHLWSLGFYTQLQYEWMPFLICAQGRTALHWSCNNGYLDAVKLLLGYNAFPNHMEHTEER